MLPATVRMRRREDFAATQRRGRRVGRRTLVVHARAPGPLTGGTSGSTGGVRVGFVVARSVGNSVTRHRVQRQLRHIVRAHLELLPDGVQLVVRALPAAAGRSSAELAADFTAALRRLSVSPPETEPAWPPAPDPRLST